jgi:hypothetical protein
MVNTIWRGTFMTNKSNISTPAYLKIGEELSGKIAGSYYAPRHKTPVE